jgi:hypothetical protein
LNNRPCIKRISSRSNKGSLLFKLRARQTPPSLFGSTLANWQHPVLLPCQTYQTASQRCRCSNHPKDKPLLLEEVRVPCIKPRPRLLSFPNNALFFWFCARHTEEEQQKGLKKLEVCSLVGAGLGLLQQRPSRFSLSWMEGFLSSFPRISGSRLTHQIPSPTRHDFRQSFVSLRMFRTQYDVMLFINCFQRLEKRLCCIS